MGVKAGSFAGIVAADMHFPTRMMASSFRHPHEPHQGFNVCSPVRSPTMFRRTPLGVPSPFPHHNRHPRHEERQQEEDDSVAEGVTHAVVEELHAGLGPEEFRGHV